ncbi:MAG TPA: NHL repeat-containing protein [bacterium]|nr:NHL repeat-containing protein [bacterium]
MNPRSFPILLALWAALPGGAWARHHSTPTPEETATPTATSTSTPIPYDGPKLYTYDTGWGSKGSGPDELNSPEGIDVAPDGSMIIADTANSRIVIWDREGRPVTTYGSFGSRADWQNPPQFNHPTAVFRSPASGQIFVSDTLNQRIVVLDDKGLVVSTWGAQGNANGQFNQPRSIGQDHFGNILVLDTGNSRVQTFSALGQFISTWGALGEASPNTYTARMNQPQGMAINPIDQALVADTGNFRFQVFNTGGVPVTVQGWYGDGPDQFREPTEVAQTPQGLIAVTDGVTGRVEFFNHRFEFIGQWTASDEQQAPNYHPHFKGIASDGEGRLYLADTQNSTILRIKPLKAPDEPKTPTPSPRRPTPTPIDSDPYGGAGFPIR